MSWFEEQLKYREDADNADFEGAIDSIANAVMGNRLRDSLSKHDIAGSAIDEILKYYHCRIKNEKLPPQIKTVDEQIEYCMRPLGIKSRNVTLERGWYRHAIGAMLGTLKEDGSVVALIPGKIRGYKLIDVKNGKRLSLNAKTEKLLDREALCFYDPLPLKSLKVIDLFTFMLKQMSLADMVLYIALLAFSVALGLLSPYFTKWLFGDVLESGSVSTLIALAVFMLSFSVSQLCFNCFKGLITSRIGIKQDIAVRAAVMNRILSLPTAFFKEYSSGELYKRIAYLEGLCQTLFNTITVTGLTSLFSLIYIGQILNFAPALVAPSLTFTLILLLHTVITTVVQTGITRHQMELSAKTSGLTYSTISGIQKVKLAGAEKRMFSRWADEYSKEAEYEYNPILYIKLSTPISLAISLIGTLIIYAVAPKPKILMFDEATSALDNITQKNVSEAIDKLKCTRIVIAHRLSTIRHADRIICLDGGRIVEEGTYDELIAKEGFFAELVKRQRLDV